MRITHYVMARPTFSSPEVVVGFPYRDMETATAEADYLREHSTNYSVRVAVTDVETGQEIITEDDSYLAHQPLN